MHALARDPECTRRVLLGLRKSDVTVNNLPSLVGKLRPATEKYLCWALNIGLGSGGGASEVTPT